MVVELGHFLLMLACVLSLLIGTIGLWAGLKQHPSGMSLVKPMVCLMAASVGLSYLALTWAFLNNDFSLLYVINQSHTLLPWWYRIAAVWGGHEGSLLLLISFLEIWLLAVCMKNKQLPKDVQVIVVAVLSLIAFGILLFILFTSNPFLRTDTIPLEGLGLNPLLQDIGLIIHPPLLYMGYVGFSVAFALAITALLLGRLDATWARYSRPWTMAAWGFLSLGILVGSIWAYYELGWGGWWFWDPVENASFMPWLAGTALMHSLAVTEKRGSFKRWTVLLAILTFSLSLLGMFLVRSGVLTSVHSFATDPGRGLFILIFLAVVVGSALVLYTWRVPQLLTQVKFDLISRETGLLANNVFLVTACLSVLVGTLFPLIMDVLDAGKFSVGAPYFNRVFVPLMLGMLLFLGVTVLLSWRQQKTTDWIKRAGFLFLVAVVLGLSLPLMMSEWRWGVAVASVVAIWVLVTSLSDLVKRVRLTRHQRTWLVTLIKQPRSFLGMHIAHIGVGVFILGAAWATGYGSEKHYSVAPNETIVMAGYGLTFKHLEVVQGPNYQSLMGHFLVTKKDKPVAWLYPEKRKYVSSELPMTEASIYHTPLEDVYVSMGEMLGDSFETSPWLVRFYYRPLMAWVWYGVILMALGALLSLTDGRYRSKLRNKRQA